MSHAAYAPTQAAGGDRGGVGGVSGVYVRYGIAEQQETGVGTRVYLRVHERQPREQATIFLDIHFFLKSLRQRKISIKLLLVRLYRMLFCAYNGACLTHF